MPQESVNSIVRRSKNSIHFSTTKTIGRKPKLTSGQHSHLLNYVHLLMKEPLYLIALLYCTPNAEKLYMSTIRRCLYTIPVRSYVAEAKPDKSTNHITARLRWSMEREHWKT